MRLALIGLGAFVGLGISSWATTRHRQARSVPRFTMEQATFPYEY